jgi:alpha-amylase/alpha-mannosidase (GH57 family)
VNRYVCVHGHFYQPPRENPWLEVVERQPTAAPFHDWNERVTAECYRPNATARRLDDQDRIREISNNYAGMSFDVGPTLMAWLEGHAPDVYAAIVRADETSRRRFGGHGSAMAQAYNHIIMPLATDRDRRTQVRWGIADFERRFGRSPEGMWLPETAVDLASLEALAAEGIRFTVLAPHQARRVRPLAGGEWRAVDERSLDTGRAYLQKLPSGRTIALFFYQGPLARGVAFGGWLESGASFASKLLEAARSPDAGGARLAHLAADGETYGHHHRFGEMALAEALARVEAADDVALTNYGGFLERHPPTLEVEIAEGTSWSCVHGVERWRSDCGCHSDGEEGWSQAWRAPLRRALDALRDGLAPRFESEGGALLEDPWAARDAYIDVILDRDPARRLDFLDRHARPAAAGEREARDLRALRLLEMQRHLQLMYTSCGWFFNDLAGIETLQVLAYAARALELAERALGDVESLRQRFLSILSSARSNRAELGSGLDLWEGDVLARSAGLEDAASHWAVRTVLEGVPGPAVFYAWEVDAREECRTSSGLNTLVLGTASVRSRVTLESRSLRWGALRVGELSVTAGVGDAAVGDAAVGDAARGDTAGGGAAPLAAAVESGDLAAALDMLQEGYARSPRSLRTLWPEERRRALERVSDRALEGTAEAARLLYERRAPLLRALTEAGLPVPRLWEAAASFVLEASLEEILAGPSPDDARVRALIERCSRSGVRLDDARIRRSARASLEAAADRFALEPVAEGRLEALRDTLAAVRALPYEVGLRQVQDRWWEVRQDLEAGAAAPPDEPWRAEFDRLGGRLGFSEDAGA